MLKLKLQYFGHLMQRTDLFIKAMMLGKIEDRRRRGRQRMRCLMASPTQWMWVWMDSRSLWRTGRPGMLQSMDLQRVGHHWVTELTDCGQESLIRIGVAIIFNKIVLNSVHGCILKNSRMISVHFQGKAFNITVTQVYSPTSYAKEAEVEWFYEDLQDLLELTHTHTKMSFSL